MINQTSVKSIWFKIVKSQICTLIKMGQISKGDIGFICWWNLIKFVDLESLSACLLKPKRKIHFENQLLMQKWFQSWWSEWKFALHLSWPIFQLTISWSILAHLLRFLLIWTLPQVVFKIRLLVFPLLLVC